MAPFKLSFDTFARYFMLIYRTRSLKTLTVVGISKLTLSIPEEQSNSYERGTEDGEDNCDRDLGAGR